MHKVYDGGSTSTTFEKTQLYLYVRPRRDCGVRRLTYVSGSWSLR
jgi:hypothetical protein